MFLIAMIIIGFGFAIFYMQQERLAEQPVPVRIKDDRDEYYKYQK